MYGNTKLSDQTWQILEASLRFSYQFWRLLWRMPWPCSPCVAPCASFESRTRMSQSLMFSQRIMQGPAYQEKERRAATWNAAGCGCGLSESDMELVRSKSRPCGRKRKVAVSRTRNENSGSEQVPADGGGKRGGGASQAERQH
jgi:hypothetical protein